MTALHHIGYYVDDLEQAIHRAIHDLGIGPFLRHEHIAFYEFTCADGIARAEPVVFDHSAAFGAWGALVLELAEVHDIDDGLARAYGVTPGAVSHVSWHTGGPLFPHPIELHESNFAIDGMHARLTDLAAGWDGVTDPIRPMRPPAGHSG